MRRLITDIASHPRTTILLATFDCGAERDGTVQRAVGDTIISNGTIWRRPVANVVRVLCEDGAVINQNTAGELQSSDARRTPRR